MALVFPQEAGVQYATTLMQIAEGATRDISTLTRQAATLMGEGPHGRVMAFLRKYANERERFRADEIREIVADMEAYVDPKIVEQNKRIQAGREARAEERREREEAVEKASWEPGGGSFRKALAQMKADAHTLIFAAKTIEDSDDQRLIGVLRGYCEDEERRTVFSRLREALKPPPEASPAPSKRRSRARPRTQGGNVVDGPWAS